MVIPEIHGRNLERQQEFIHGWPIEIGLLCSAMYTSRHVSTQLVKDISMKMQEVEDNSNTTAPLHNRDVDTTYDT